MTPINAPLPADHGDENNGPASVVFVVPFMPRFRFRHVLTADACRAPVEGPVRLFGTFAEGEQWMPANGLSKAFTA